MKKVNKAKKVAIIGTGKRFSNLYHPVLAKLTNIDLQGIHARDSKKLGSLAKRLNVQAYLTIEDVFDDQNVDLIIVNVDWTENAKVYRKLADTDKRLLIETPLGHDFNAAKQAYQSLQKISNNIDVAEQYPHRPVEILKRALIKKGIFGNVFYTFCCGIGHEYHGFSLMRSYLGFEEKISEIRAQEDNFDYYNHIFHSNVFFEGERLQSALFKYQSGAVGVYQWSWLSYESPIRFDRRSGFYGTLGACSGNELKYFKNSYTLPKTLHLEKRTRVVNGIEVLQEYVAFDNDGTILDVWSNPFADMPLSDEEIPTALFICNALSDNFHPIYPLRYAYEDHVTLEGMRKSIDEEIVWKREGIS